MVANKAAAFCPAWAMMLGQREPDSRYSQANRLPVMKIGISTPGDTWNTLKIMALIIIAPGALHLGIRPAKMKPRKKISSVKGVHKAKARKVSATPGPGNTMSTGISGGSKISVPANLTSKAYRAVAPRLSNKTPTVIPTHLGVGTSGGLSPREDNDARYGRKATAQTMIRITTPRRRLVSQAANAGLSWPDS